MSATPVQGASTRCPFCREPARSTLDCPRCAAPAHPACAWELGRCAACGAAALLDLLAAARLGDPPGSPGWSVGAGWAAAVRWSAPAAPGPLVPRLSLTLEPPSLLGLWVGGEVTLELPAALRACELRLECAGDALARLRLLPAGELAAGRWVAAFRVRRGDGRRSLELRAALHPGGLWSRGPRLRAGLRVGPLATAQASADSRRAPARGSAAGSTGSTERRA